jgi:hypothetical protein
MRPSHDVREVEVEEEEEEKLRTGSETGCEE